MGVLSAGRAVALFGASLAVGGGFAVTPAYAQASRAKAPVTESVPARDLLRKALSRYDGLDSFSMTLRHKDSSGLFPGTFRQELKWRKGGQFTLRATDLDAVPASSPSQPGGPAPHYYADGRRVVSDFPDGRRYIDDIRPRPNTSPGWEVSGGLIVSRLMKTETAGWLFDPPKELGFTPKWEYGPRTRWQGHPVREIVGSATLPGGNPWRTSFFVAPDGSRLVGTETKLRRDGTGEPGYNVFEDQRFNPRLPAALGTAPKARPGTKVTDHVAMSRSAPERAPARPRPPLLAEGVQAPDFTVEGADGQPLKLSDLRGKVVVLDFWATWCGPCIASMPHTNAVAAKFAGQDVVVLAVNTSDNKEAYTKWLAREGKKYGAIRFAIDPESDTAGPLYKVSGIPTQYVIAPDGKVAASFVGYGGPSGDLEKAILAARSPAGGAPASPTTPE